MTTHIPDAFHHHWPPRLSKSLRPPRTTLWDNLVTSARSKKRIAVFSG